MSPTFPPSRFVRRGIRWVLPAFVCVLSGCAALGLGANADDASATSTDATAASSADANPANPAFDIRVELADRALRAMIERHNELQRYRALADLDDTEFARLMVLAERDVRNLLGAEGYFSPQVQLRREGGPAGAAGTASAAGVASTTGAGGAPDPALSNSNSNSNNAGAAGRPVVVIAIEPGPPTLVRRVGIDFEGDIASSADAGAVQQRSDITGGWRLPAGRRFTQQAWGSAKTDALRKLVERRYPRGKISYSLADVDAPSAEASLALRLDSGPLFRLGPAVVKGAERYPEFLPERLSWLKPGEIYDQKRLVDAQQRLAGSGYYDSAYISIDPEGDPEAAPVTYAVTEAKRHKLQLGVGYSTDGGPRVTLEHRDNTVFGTSWRATSKLQLDTAAPLLQTELSSLPNANGWRSAVFARYMREDDDSLITTSQTLRFGRIKSEERYDRNIYLQYDHASVTGAASQVVPDALLGDGAAISVNYAWTGRYFDTLPVPSSGYGLHADVGVGMTTVAPRKPFARLYGRWLGIVPMEQKSRGRLALRTELGAILASKAARLPGSYMYRTGGDTTVRGYSYRSIGIPLGGDFIGPGRYVAVASLEWQRPILQDRFPGLLEHTVFIDVGGVANRVGDLRANWGIGTGVRLITPVGPMALDLAYGLQSKQFRLHMNVGFTF